MTAHRRLTVLVTRPRAESDVFAVALAMRGHEALVAPMIEIVPIAGAHVDLDGAQAVLFTSANGVRAFAAAETRRDLPAYCVGDATATAARDAGFAQVESASGDVVALAALVRARLAPSGGALVHAAGTSVAGDLAGDLARDGFSVRRVPLYRSETAAALTDDARAALREGRVDVVAFFSPRTAQAFAQLADEARLADGLGRVTALALATTSHDALRAAGCGFGAFRTAAAPTEAALLDELDRIAQEAPLPPASDKPKFELPPSSDPPPPPRAKPRAGVLVPMATALVVAVAGILGWAYWQSTMTGGAEPGMRALETRLATLERRVGQVEARPTAAPAARVDLGPLEARLAALETRPPSVAAAPADAALDARLAALEARPAADPALAAQLAALAAENRRLTAELAGLQGEIARLQGGAAESAGDRAGLRRAERRLALAQLREALAAGRAYTGELGVLRDLAGDGAPAEAFAALTPFAPSGIETLDSLARRFPDIANAVVAAARSDAVPGVAGELLQRAQSFLSVRRVGDVPGDSPSARVARAETRLAAGDLAGAVAALDGLQGQPGAAPALPWLDVARRRLAAERALAALAAASGG
jgi:uroporphyrinogen-III synthase